MIYFIKGKKFVKIGVAANPESRLKDIQTGNPFPLKIVATISGHFATEKELHTIFERFRVEGEWFQYKGFLQNCIEGINDPRCKHKEIKTITQLVENGHHLGMIRKAKRNRRFRTKLDGIKRTLGA